MVDQFEYQLKNRFFAQVQRGLADLAAEELTTLGASECSPQFSGVEFSADIDTLYSINYMSRLSGRILAPLFSFGCFSDQQLYQKALTVNWERILDIDKSFAVFADVANSRIRHSHFAALRLKDAIADYFRNKKGRRPNVDSKQPDTGIHLLLHNNRALLSLDTSGGTLKKRGYRIEAGEAPLQETLAAAIIRLSRWQGERPLVDIMCGSGTLLAEAAMDYCRIPPAFKRSRFGFFALPEFQVMDWLAVKERWDKQRRPLPDNLIRGSDIGKRMVRVARRNLNLIPFGNRVGINALDFREIEKIQDSILVVNPPWGLRQGEEEAAETLFKELGDFLKQRCTGCEVYIFTSRRELLKKLGLRISKRFILFNGALESRLAKVLLY